MKTNTKTNTKSTAVKPARKPKAVKPVGTVAELMAALDALLALGFIPWKRNRTSLHLDETIKGSGRIYENYYGSSLYFNSYADGTAKILAEVEKRKNEAELEVMRQKTLTKVAEVGGYTAEVSSTGIKVGCQNISLAKFAELSKAVDKVNTVVAAEKAKAKTATAKK